MCGKSTVMRMLVPFPLDRSMFNDDGYSVLQLIHNDIPYLITTAFDRYSFIQSGDELNPMGKIGVQRKLCLEHFGLTQKLVDMLLGRTDFTSMTDTARREWALSLSNIDYEYVLDMHTRVRKDLTYTKNIIKHQAEQLAELGEVESVKDLRVELEETSMYALLLEPIADYNRVDPNTLKSKLSDVHTKIDAIGKLVTNDLPSNLDATYIKQKSESTHVELEITRCIGEIDELEKSLSGSVTNDELDEMHNKLSGLRTDQSKYTKWKYSEDRVATNNTVIQIGADLERYYDLHIDKSSDELMRISRSHTDIIAHYEGLQTALAKDELLLSHINNHQHTCPECDHTFADYGDMEKAVMDAKVNYKMNKKMLSRIVLPNDDDVTETQAHLKAQLWHDGVQSLTYPWGDDTQRGLHNIMSALESNERYESYVVRIDKISMQIDLVTTMDKTLHTKATKRMFDLRNELDCLNGTSVEVRREIDTTEHHIRKRDKLVNYAEQYTRLVTEKTKTYKLLMHTIRSTSACNELDVARTRIREINSAILRHDHKANTIKELEQSMAKLNNERDALNTLVVALSPQSGLIAHTLKEFQTYFVSLINQYISHIWTKEMIVSAPRNKQMYPVYCNSQSDDIKETSEGMQEILNLAFRLAVVKLSLPEFPIMFDEVGVNLDEKHRVAMYDYVNQHLFNEYPNAFIISHYKDLYSMFSTDTEFAVLNSDNIDISLLPIQSNTGLTFH